MHSIQEQDYKHSIKQAESENVELRKKISVLEEDFKTMEKKYIDSKLGWTNSDIEREATAQKYKEAQERLRNYSSDYTTMEVELYKLNERFGQTLNNNNELEMEMQRLRSELAETGKKGRKR